MGTIYAVNEAVVTASVAEHIDLSTPGVHQISISPKAETGPSIPKYSLPTNTETNIA